MTSRTATVTSALLTLAVMSGISSAGDWPQWRGPQRDGIAHDESIRSDWDQNPPKLKWHVQGVGEGYASLAVVDGRIYTTGNKDGAQAVTCLNAADGSVIWSTPISNRSPEHGYPGARCTPSIDGDRLYAVASDGRIVCLELSDGKKVWSREFSDWGGKMMSGWGFSESPLVDGDRVLCTPGGPRGVMVALNKENGREIWAARLPRVEGRGKDGAGYSSIVISEGGGVKQYVTLVGRGVIGVRASDGQLLWGYNRVANDTANIPTPLVDGDFVFASSGYGTGAALLRLSRGRGGITANEVYFLEAKDFQNHHGGMILSDGYVYAGHQHNKGFPICLEMKSGKTVWGGRIRPAGGGSAAITAVGDQLVFRYQDGTLALLEMTPEEYRLYGTFRPVYQERESWSHPVVVDGTMYLREQDHVMSYDVAAK